MTEEKQEIKKIEEEKVAEAEKDLAKDISKTEEKVDEGKITQKQADKEIKKEVKEEIKDVKDAEVKKVKEKFEKEIKGLKKTEAVVNGRNLPVSTKHSIAICNYIRKKDLDKAIFILEEVDKMKKAIPMKGEIPHRRGKIMSGRYPIKAVGEFIKLLKSLRSNAIANGLELEKYVLFCKANIAARPYRRFGRTKFKRTHVTLKLIKNVKKRKKDKGARK